MKNKCSGIEIEYIPYETSTVDVQGKKHYRRDAAKLIITTNEHKEPLDIREYVPSCVGEKEFNKMVAEKFKIDVEKGKLSIYSQEGFYIMNEKENPNKNRELTEEANTNMIDGIINNLPPAPVPSPEKKPLDRVKPPTEKKRSRGLER
jgi:hypothetical protein